MSLRPGQVLRSFLLALCLLRGLPSLLAVPALAVAILVPGAPRPPDILVAPNAAAVAVRGPDGHLSVIGAKGQKMMVEQWLARVDVGADHRPRSAPVSGGQLGVDGAGALLQRVVAFVGVAGPVGLLLGPAPGALRGQFDRHVEQDLAIRHERARDAHVRITRGRRRARAR